MPIHKNGQKITPKPRLRSRPTMGLGNILYALCLDPAPFAQNHGSAALLSVSFRGAFLTVIRYNILYLITVIHIRALEKPLQWVWAIFCMHCVWIPHHSPQNHGSAALLLHLYIGVKYMYTIYMYS